MSAAPTDCRVPDPTDAKADGGFGNHRAGYSPDRLAQAEHWARKGGTLAAGEGLVLCAEIDRLRAILAALRNPSMAVIAGAFSAGAIWDVVTNTRKTIQLAVAAAEREVTNDAG